MRKLVVVESPHKARRILAILTKAFPNDSWQVFATLGHFVDLPKKRFGIDPQDDFALEWVTKNKAIARELVKVAKWSERAYICTDPDREGEGIAQHVYFALNNHLDDADIYRATFHEITSQAILNAISNPAKLNDSLVSAQYTRRACDRLIGYMTTPVLWRQVGAGLTAGRVQTCVLNEIVERTRKRRNFVASNIFYVSAKLANGSLASSARFSDRKSAEDLLAALQKGPITNKYSEYEEERKPPPVLKTSELIKLANRKYNYSSSYTMQLAQRLYEAGYITYHRTSSVAINAQAAAAARKVVLELCGQNYGCVDLQLWSHSQGAHEGIRASYPNTLPSSANINVDQQKVYTLVWARTLASQSVSATVMCQRVEYSTSDVPVVLVATGSYLTFDGWHKPSGGLFLPNYNKLDPTKLDIVNLELKFSQTEPPPRYNEASLVSWMERNGIGRPSTYAPTIQHILKHQYVSSSQQGIESKLRGEFITKFINAADAKLLSPEFTASLEKLLDEVEFGTQSYLAVVKQYYQHLVKIVAAAQTQWLKTVATCHCSIAFEVWLDKRGEPYLWCPKCENWLWASIDSNNDIVAQS